MTAIMTSRIFSLKRILGKIFQAIARLPLVPSFVRNRLYRLLGVNFLDGKSVFIGENVYFDDARPDLITVGRGVMVSSGVKILAHFLDTKHVSSPAWPFRFYDGEVVIGDYVFIGTNAVIAKPVVIGDWAVIGANSVITHDVPAAAIMVGSPARQVGSRVVGNK